MIPLVYHTSHVLPWPDGERGGGVDIASLPKHVRATRGVTGSDHTPAALRELEAFGGYDPYLRLGVTGRDGTGTVVLTEPQVRLVYETLGEWLRGLT